MKRFEYKVIYTKVGAITSIEKLEQKYTKELNELGAQGWELVNSGSSGLSNMISSTFKREVN
ncbi:MAG: DUF4177 domain-containing protein [Peptococcaceae bacterium]|nr:DUF4177 domain-containing protein [Peptococcaceae bacterium]